VIAGPPLEVAQGQLIRESVALLALVLKRARIDAVGCDDQRVVGGSVSVIGAIRPSADSVGVVERVLVAYENLVEPAVGAALPAKIDARVVVVVDGGGGLRLAGADIAVTGLAPDLALQHEAIVGRRLPIELAEIQVLGEFDLCRTQLSKRFSRELRDNVRRHVAGY